MSPNQTMIPPTVMDYWQEEIEVTHRSKYGTKPVRISYIVPDDLSYWASSAGGKGRNKPPEVPDQMLQALAQQVAIYLRDWHDQQRYGYSRNTRQYHNQYNTSNAYNVTTTSSTTVNYNNAWPTQYGYNTYYPDWDASPRRKPQPKEFNKYINASDMLEEFIKFLGSENVRQEEAFQLPVDLFIKWLVVRACEADQEEPPEDVEISLKGGLVARKQLSAPAKQPRCLGCQRYMSKGIDVPFHDHNCFARYEARTERVVKGPPILVDLAS